MIRYEVRGHLVEHARDLERHRPITPELPRSTERKGCHAAIGYRRRLRRIGNRFLEGVSGAPHGLGSGDTGWSARRLPRRRSRPC